MTKRFTRAEKIDKSEEIIRESYYKKSVLEQLVNVKVAHPDEQDFLKLGLRLYIPEDWYSREDIYYDIALQQLGEKLAFSEKKHILEEVLKSDKIKRTFLPEEKADSPLADENCHS